MQRSSLFTFYGAWASSISRHLGTAGDTGKLCRGCICQETDRMCCVYLLLRRIPLLQALWFLLCMTLYSRILGINKYECCLAQVMWIVGESCRLLIYPMLPYKHSDSDKQTVAEAMSQSFFLPVGLHHQTEHFCGGVIACKVNGMTRVDANMWFYSRQRKLRQRCVSESWAKEGKGPFNTHSWCVHF